MGLADDATAAYTNPAGLTQLVTPEVSIEVRHTEYSLPYVNGGSASVSPFDNSGLNISNADSSKNNVSFLSFVIPHDRWSFAFYRDEVVNFDTDFASVDTGEVVPGVGTAFPVTAHANLKIVDYGLTAAWKASDAISLGLGFSYYDFNINTNINRFGYIPDFTATNIALNSQAQFGSDNDFGVNLGARFVFSEHWSAGLTYRRGPTFNYEATSTALANVFQNSDGTFTPVAISPTVVTDLKSVRFKVPDQFGSGLSWHPTDALVINFDADYIQYSQLTSGIQSLFGNGPATVSSLSIPNGTEVHLGGEYTFTANGASIQSSRRHLARPAAFDRIQGRSRY